MKRFTRQEVLDRLYGKIASGTPIIGAGAGTALIGKVLDEAGCDLIFAYCTGSFRMDGYQSAFGMLPFLDCDQETIELGNRLMRVVNNTPIICGIGSGSPTADTEVLLERFIDGVGYAGIINVPIDPYYPEKPGCTRGIYGERCSRVDATLRKSVENIRIANRRDVFTCAYAFTEESMQRFSAAGCDMLIPHLGGTMGGTAGFPLEDSEAFINSEIERLCLMVEVSRRENPNGIVIVHGGILSTPENVRKALMACHADGFVGASSTERIPVEEGIAKVMSDLRAIKKR